ncbi:MAG: RNA methyltransferase [Salinivirgaceae bacterium]|nr:RNA methyltransferase [Salinivirgaceae bacterium]
MLSNNTIKFIKSLDKKKFRTEHNCFIVEGEKMVLELLQSNKFKIKEVFTTDSTLQSNYINQKISLIAEKELNRISSLKTPNKHLALVEIPKSEPTTDYFFSDLSLVLDNIQDPGNFGTIIRTASWFGIKTIYCSRDTVEAYNTKVIQSTMGAIFNINIIYTELIPLLQKAKNDKVSIYGTLLKGENIYNAELSKKALVIMGNESKGVSKELEKYIDKAILIPNFPENTRNIESLNVGVACAIVCSEFRRRALSINNY